MSPEEEEILSVVLEKTSVAGLGCTRRALDLTNLRWRDNYIKLASLM